MIEFTVGHRRLIKRLETESGVSSLAMSPRERAIAKELVAEGHAVVAGIYHNEPVYGRAVDGKGSRI